LYEKLGKSKEAALAYLCLALYQLEAGKIEEAIKTLKRPEFGTVNTLQLQCYFYSKHPERALELMMESSSTLTQYDPKELYKFVLTQNPKAFKLYPKLAELMSDVQTQAHILLTGAFYALSVGYDKYAEILCQEALKLKGDSLLDHFVRLELVRKNDEPSAYIQALESLANFFEEKGLTKQVRKTNKILFQLNNKPEYCKKVIGAYGEDKNDKLLQWYKIYTYLLEQKNTPNESPEIVLDISGVDLDLDENQTSILKLQQDKITLLKFLLSPEYNYIPIETLNEIIPIALKDPDLFRELGFVKYCEAAIGAFRDENSKKKVKWYSTYTSLLEAQEKDQEQVTITELQEDNKILLDLFFYPEYKNKTKETFKILFEIAPKDPRAFCEHGCIHEDKAIKEFFLRKAIQLGSKDPRAPYDLGCLLSDDKVSEKVQCFIMAIENDPLFVEAYFELTKIMSEKVDIGEDSYTKDELIDKILEIDPHHAGAKASREARNRILADELLQLDRNRRKSSRKSGFFSLSTDDD